jgi:hypothetical protein
VQVVALLKKGFDILPAKRGDFFRVQLVALTGSFCTLKIHALLSV